MAAYADGTRLRSCCRWAASGKKASTDLRAPARSCATAALRFRPRLRDGTNARARTLVHELGLARGGVAGRSCRTMGSVSERRVALRFRCRHWVARDAQRDRRSHGRWRSVYRLGVRVHGWWTPASRAVCGHASDGAGGCDRDADARPACAAGWRAPAGARRSDSKRRTPSLDGPFHRASASRRPRSPAGGSEAPAPVAKTGGTRTTVRRSITRLSCETSNAARRRFRRIDNCTIRSPSSTDAIGTGANAVFLDDGGALPSCATSKPATASSAVGCSYRSIPTARRRPRHASVDRQVPDKAMPARRWPKSCATVPRVHRTPRRHRDSEVVAYCRACAPPAREDPRHPAQGHLTTTAEPACGHGDAPCQAARVAVRVATYRIRITCAA